MNIHLHTLSNAGSWRDKWRRSGEFGGGWEIYRGVWRAGQDQHHGAAAGQHGGRGEHGGPGNTGLSLVNTDHVT